MHIPKPWNQELAVPINHCRSRRDRSGTGFNPTNSLSMYLDVPVRQRFSRAHINHTHMSDYQFRGLSLPTSQPLIFPTAWKNK